MIISTKVFMQHFWSVFRAILPLIFLSFGTTALAGISAGGYGAVNFALKHHHMFAAGEALSPASYVDLSQEYSSAYTQPVYLNADEDFDKGKWRALNYPDFIGDYKTQDIVMPLHISSGGHDHLDIAYHSTVLYQKLGEHQPKKIELRIINGEYDNEVWNQMLPESMEYVFQFVTSMHVPEQGKTL